MELTRTCAECGAPIPEEARQSLCPRCLLNLGLNAGVEGALQPGPSVSDQAPPPGTKIRYIGDYELLEEIARGGMGVVWRARQVSLGRIVALKMILKGELASEADVQRFRREAQAVANLDHPNIVGVYEVGEHEGQHYFSMQLVEGSSLAAEARGQRSEVRGLKRVARLMAKVARAVHHAHQRGILHRDIKPGNILIDAKGEPHVTDFGLAKRVDMPSELTGSEMVMGTPNYMSPEQAERKKDLTTATDIWSLGAVLYHLLTGQPPFQRGTAWETLNAAVKQEPAWPSALNGAVDRDVETICLKCLLKDPARRYASADALAEDLERWLRDEPIVARPSSSWQRIMKWSKRNPALAGMTGALVLVFVLSFVFVAWQWHVARREAIRSEQVHRVLNEMLPGVAPYKALGRDTKMLPEILDEAAARAGQDLKGRPEVEAPLRTTLGVTYMELGEYRQAELMLRAALSLERSVHGNKHPDVANALNNLASVLTQLNKLDEAERMLREALAVEKKLQGDEKLIVAASRNNLANFLQKRNKPGEAEATYRQILSMQRKLLGNEHPDIARSLINLAAVLMKDGSKPEEAESTLREALAMQRKLLGKEHPDIASSLHNLANVLQDRGQLQEAEAMYRDALAMRTKLLGREHPDYAISLNNLAIVLRDRGQLEEAETMQREALAIRKKLYSNEHPDVADSVHNLGIVLWRRGKVPEAEQMYCEALAIRKKLPGNQHQEIARLLFNLANMMRSCGRLEEAEGWRREALAFEEGVHGEEHAHVANALQNLAVLLTESGKLDEAETTSRQAVEMRKKLLGPDHPDTLASMCGLAALYKDSNQAVKVYREAAELGATGAQIKLGELLGEGSIVTPDLVEACQWLILAVDRGDKSSKILLERIRARLTPKQQEEARKRADGLARCLKEKKAETKDSSRNSKR